MSLPFAFSIEDRLYLQPTAFVDSPVGFNETTGLHRLAGGLNWYAAYRVIVARGGRRVSETLVPSHAIEAILAGLPAPAQSRAKAQLSALQAPRADISVGVRTIRLNEPQIVGILNVTPDSFSDGGRDSGPDAAAARAVDMATQGAAIIDIGGESTRPGAKLVWEGDEVERAIPVIERLARSGTAISIDTRKAGVMEAAIKTGAGMINDIAALGYDDRAVTVAAQANCPVVLMHAPSQTSDPHAGGTYADVVLDVYDWLEQRIAAVMQGGVAHQQIIVDPGIGFGKSLSDNLALINALPLFHALGCPLMVGASRKRLIGAIDNEVDADHRLAGSLAIVFQAAAAGVQLHRVHDVAETRQTLRVWRAGRDVALTRIAG